MQAIAGDLVVTNEPELEGSFVFSPACLCSSLNPFLFSLFALECLTVHCAELGETHDLDDSIGRRKRVHFARRDGNVLLVKWSFDFASEQENDRVE